MPATVVCPECATELQLQRAPTMHAAIRCCACQNVFSIELIDTVQLANAPAPRSRGFSSPPPPPPPRLAPTPQLAPELPHAEDANVAVTEPARELSSPPPPVVASQMPGLPKPNVLSRTVAARFNPPFHETVLGATLIVGVLVGLVAGALVFWQFTNARPTVAGTSDGPEGKADEKAKDAPIVTAKSNLPAELIGVWIARCDDASVMALELRGDGQASFSQSDDGSAPAAQRGFWMERGHRGNEYMIDFVAAVNSFQPVRFTVTLTSPTAFTLTRLVAKGAVNRDEVRFARRQ